MSKIPEFTKSVFDLKDLPTDGTTEIAFIGRSNVGKSSLINSLASRKQLARTSGKPGKTQSLNYYLFPDKYYIVDTPGYGYAARSKKDRDVWRGIMDEYVSGRDELAAIGILIDARHEGLENDITALEWLVGQGKPWFAILTKIDKVKQKDISAHEKYLKAEFSGAELLFGVSVVSGIGVKRLSSYLRSLVPKK